MTESPLDKIELIIRGRRVMLPQGESLASVHIGHGVIHRVAQWSEIEPGVPVFDAGEDVIMPGVVDIHAHINEPGRTEWEGFQSATRAAAAGGITMLIDMPLNSVPATTNVAALASKIAAASGKLWVDIGFHGGIVPNNGASLRELWQAGVIGLKCFLCDSGVEEFPPVSDLQLESALGELRDLNPWLLVHAEAPEILDAARAAEKSSPDKRLNYADFLRSRPDDAEYRAVQNLIGFCESYGVRTHIVHLSSASVLPLLSAAKQHGLKITAETCPHYLTFDAETIPAEATEYKCAPPIRSAANREKLWQGLKDGIIDVIATDHSPCTPELKRRETGDFAHSWGGIASLQFALPAVWTQAGRRGIALSEIVQWMCTRPAELAGLSKKGSIALGKDADIICFRPEAEIRVEAEDIFHRHKLTPYLGKKLTGWVGQTFVRGQLVYDQGRFSAAPLGQWLSLKK